MRFVRWSSAAARVTLTRMKPLKLPRVGSARAERIAVFLVGVLLAIGLWQAYGVLLSGVA